MIERAGQGCAIGYALFERIHQPYAREGQRTGALRFGDSTRHGPDRRLVLVSSTPSPGSPMQAFAGWWPDSSARDYSEEPDDL